MAHAHARLTHFGRLLLVQRITELGWPPARAAEALGVCRGPRPTSGWAATASTARLAWPTAAPDPTAAHALPATQVRRVLAARRRRRQGPHRLGDHLGMPRSTVYGVPPRDEPPGPHRPGQRSGGPLPTRAARGAGPAGRQEAGPDPRRWRPSRSWPGQRGAGRGIGNDDVHSAVDDRSGSPSASSWLTSRPPRPRGSWSRRPASWPTTGCRSSGC
jgi:hypothetical protein